MIAHPVMALEPAQQAGMKVPENVDEFDANEYPHFNVFLNAQLGSPMPYAGCHWDNAKVIAKIPDDRIKEITVAELLELGFAAGFSRP